MMMTNTGKLHVPSEVTKGLTKKIMADIFL